MATSAKASRVEFNDKLIGAIQKRPILWDSTRKDFKEQRKRMAAWAEVATEVGCDPEDNNLQGRWKSLRDTFTKKHRAWKTGAPSGSGAADAQHVKWPYFHMMMFLKDQVDIGRWSRTS
ncbi:transcription factor Adf-1-like [Amblyomma americanum]